MCGNWVLSSERRREGGRGWEGGKLAGSACQIHSRSQQYLTSPHRVLNYLRHPPVIFPLRLRSCSSQSSTNTEGVGSLLMLQDKSFISHLLLSPYSPLPFTPVAYWTRWMAAALCEPEWIFFYTYIYIYIIIFLCLWAFKKQQLQQRWQIRRPRSPTLSQTQQLLIPARPRCGTASAPRMASPTTITSQPKAPVSLSSSPRAMRWKSQTVWREKVTSSIAVMSGAGFSKVIDVHERERVCVMGALRPRGIFTHSRYF